VRVRGLGLRTSGTGVIAKALPLLLIVASGGSAAVVHGYGARTARPALRRRANPVQRENRMPGSKSWSLDQTAPPRTIEGFASEVSVLPGQKVHLHISTAPAARYRIVLYRLGWYHGDGARIFACISDCASDRHEKARLQPHPRPGKRSHSSRLAGHFRFPRSAVSGYCLAKLELEWPRSRQSHLCR
jgi:hypothetical protein